MTWVRYDDNVRNHPKVEALDDATYRLWREAIEWCAQNLTDGIILARQLGLTSTRANPARARKLVDAGLLHKIGMACDSKHCPPSGADGWVVHDYWQYQPTRAKVRADQEAAAERKRKWLEGKKNGAGNTVPNDDGTAGGTPTPPRPAPPRKGGGALRAPSAGPSPVADGAAADGEESINCRTCAHALTSAYHRNACREEPAA